MRCSPIIIGNTRTYCSLVIISCPLICVRKNKNKQEEGKKTINSYRSYWVPRFFLRSLTYLQRGHHHPPTTTTTSHSSHAAGYTYLYGEKGKIFFSAFQCICRSLTVLSLSKVYELWLAIYIIVPLRESSLLAGWTAGWTADWMAGRLAAWHIYRKTGKTTTETRPGDVIIILCAPKIRVRVPQLRPLYHLFASWAPVF